MSRLLLPRLLLEEGQPAQALLQARLLLMSCTEVTYSLADAESVALLTCNA